MSYPCIPDSGYFSSPEFLSFSLHITTAISTPVHILGLYFILFKTPDQMKSVKWYLVNLHTWIVLFDYSVGLLVVPVVLLPSFAGFLFGLLADLQVPSILQALLLLTLLGCICDYIGKKYWIWLRRPWMLAHYLTIFVVLATFGYLTPYQHKAVEQVSKNLPCLPANMYHAKMFVLADDHTYHLIMIVLFIFGTCMEVLFFVLVITWNIFKHVDRKSMSQKTLQMQKTFFLALLLQMTIPAAMLTIPFIYAWICVIKNYHNQAYTNLSVVIAATHGFVSTLVMLLVHRPYRQELVMIFWRSLGKPGRVRTRNQLNITNGA